MPEEYIEIRVPAVLGSGQKLYDQPPFRQILDLIHRLCLGLEDGQAWALYTKNFIADKRTRDTQNKYKRELGELSFSEEGIEEFYRIIWHSKEMPYLKDYLDETVGRYSSFEKDGTPKDLGFDEPEGVPSYVAFASWRVNDRQINQMLGLDQVLPLGYAKAEDILDLQRKEKKRPANYIWRVRRAAETIRVKHFRFQEE